LSKLVVVNKQDYPPDLNDYQWALIAPHLPQRRPLRGQPLTWNYRNILDAILYIVRSGCGWRLMPLDFPPWQTVYGFYWQWRNNGLWVKINAILIEKVHV
jgi:transposase